MGRWSFWRRFFRANKDKLLESIIGGETKLLMRSQLKTSQYFKKLKELLVKENINNVYDIIFEEILWYLYDNFGGFMVLFKNYIVSNKKWRHLFISKGQFKLIKDNLKDTKKEGSAKEYHHLYWFYTIVWIV